MPEFSEVMRQWKRMCGEMYGCEKCPLRQADIEGTYVCDSGITCFDYKGAEPIIMAWATEHPEPVYPTWAEWLMAIGVISGLFPNGAIDALGNLKNPIPADIAEKLGLKPKEDV